ncbi:hypothetical protein C6P97_06555 [Burkholderia multivorans]|uniref:Uncharacterized protein n=1 Tax=Burkholderia multivorans TaxID=87883 RepID=A0AB37B0Q2_9BURK|nr:hypothetical protein C6P97_06555 [Burkholderia multivorans]PRE55524.1 hypothetical protein C6P99_01310 [Burkholderia multivorans]
MSAFRPDAPAAARARLICNWRSYATVCRVAPPAALISAFEKLVHALNYRRLSESCVVTVRNRRPRHVERRIRERRVLRVR